MVVNSHGGASNSLKKLNSEKFRKKAAKVDKDGLVLLISRAESLFGFIKGRAGVEQVKIAPKSELKEKSLGWSANYWPSHPKYFPTIHFQASAVIQLYMISAYSRQSLEPTRIMH